MTQRVALSVAAVIACLASLDAQGRPGGPPQPPASPRVAAPVDFTGYWVSVVTEDWRYRMMPPRKGDYMSVPLSAEGRKLADAWDPATAGSCRAYGAAALLRLPTRLRIQWESDRILTLDTDAGQQTRRLLFAPAPSPPARPSLQGYSMAEWDTPGGVPGGIAVPSRPVGPFGPPGIGDSLKVVTTHLAGGWLRQNGVPYGARAQVTEYFTRFTAPNADEWFVVTTIVTDPQYLAGEFVTSSHFKREPNGEKWNPTPCATP